jgi:5-methylcytosine-specific restriction endonuclease McrA
MSGDLSKTARVKLSQDDYRELHQQILRRDGWRCQACGSMQNLEVHHMRFRSHGGDYSEENLITLCSKCHSAAHRNRSESYSVRT